MTDLHLDLLDDIRIASPCSMRWEDLEGDGASRFCSACRLHVHDFSAMSRDEIGSLIGSSEGRICARLFRRADGTIITRDCPVGAGDRRRRTVRFVSRIAAAVGLIATGAAVAHDSSAPGLRSLQPFRALSALIRRAPAPRPMPLMGEICPAPMPTAAADPSVLGGLAPMTEPGGDA